MSRIANWMVATRRGAADGAGRFTHTMAYGGLSQLGLAQHHHCVVVEFLAGVGHGEPT